MKKIACLSFIIVLVINANAQSIFGGQDYHNVLFAEYVKSCDEFMCRFNGEESFPGLNQKDSLWKWKNFVLLFDYQLVTKTDSSTFIKEVTQIHDEVLADKIRLAYESDQWYAELRTEFIFQKKTIELGVVFQPDITPKQLECWTIAGINGLEKLGYNAADTVSRLVISPEQHEADFTELDGDFKYHAKEFSRFRSYHSDLDALSYFFALVESGCLKYSKRLHVTFHFFNIPSYVFQVNHFDRKMSNSGWLISNYKKVTKQEKEQELNKLLTK